MQEARVVDFTIVETSDNRNLKVDSLSILNYRVVVINGEKFIIDKDHLEVLLEDLSK